MNRVYKEVERPGLLDSLTHFGIKGMKWGVRRYQNEDGSLTSAGRARYGYGKVKVDARKAESEGYVTVSRKGYEDVRIANDAFREFEKEVQEGALKAIEKVYNVPYKTLIAVLDNDLDRGVSKETNRIIDECMEQSLTDLLKNPSAFEKKASDKPENTPSAYTKAPKLKIEKNKYADTSKYHFATPEEATEQAYKDLEQMVPHFYDYPQEEMDKMWIEYMNKTGLYKYGI